MGINLEQRQIQTQRLILSPQIRQFLRLLQMPVIELQAAIEQELSANPALEEATEEPVEDKVTEDLTQEEKEPDLPLGPPEDRAFTEKLDNLLKLEDNFDQNRYYSGNFESLDSESTGEVERKQAYRQSLITKPVTLADHLGWQMLHLDLEPNQDVIATHVIGNVNDDGYLTASVDEIAKETGSTVQEVEKVLNLIQQLDPPGVAARSLEECLLLQLKRLDRENHLAIRIVSECLPLLEKRKYDQIGRQLGVGEQSVKSAIKVISSLEPKPGRRFYQQEAIAVVPDVRVVKDESTDTYRSELLDDDFPRLRISSRYRRMLRDKNLDKKTKEYLRERIHSGLWFMNAMEQRRSTLKKIADAIVDIQSGYLEQGLGYLKPLRMKDVANRIGIHESTVSRAIQGKYMETPQGTIPLRSFFSSSLPTDNGSAESQTSTMEKIKVIIEKEDPKRPLSDQQIVVLLRQQGIRIARRTVAKYRDILKILPSHLRRREAAA